MIGSNLWNFVVVVAGGVTTCGLITYLILSQRFPNEDPRLVSGRFPLRQQFIPLIIAVMVSTILFFLAQFLGFMNVVKYSVYILVAFSLIVNYYLDKRYGRLGANEEPPRIGKVKVTSLLVGVVVLVTIIMLLVGFLNLPRFYVDVAWLLFFVVFIGSIIWVRRSRRKPSL